MDHSATYTAEQILKAMHGSGIEQFQIERVFDRFEE